MKLIKDNLWVIPCAVYAVLFGVLFWPGLAQMVQLWNQEDFNYCYIVPVVVLYLIWEKRKEFIGEQTVPSWRGIVPLLVGLGFYWLGELGGEFYTLYLASWFVLMGLLSMFLGWRKLRILLFPLCFLIAMFPPPNVFYSNVSLKLKLLSSRIGVQMLQLTGMPAFREGNIIDLGFSKLQVVDACSGLRYLFPLITLGILVAYHSRAAWWKKIVVVISAIPLTVITNSMRIASVGLLQPLFGPQVTEGAFHDFSGWLMFMLSLGLLLLEMWLLNRLFPMTYSDVTRASASRATAACSHRAAVLHATVLLLLSANVVVAATMDFREKVPMARPLMEFPLAIDDWEGMRQSLEEKYLDTLHLTDYLLVNYSNRRGETINLYVAYNASQTKGASSHSPATCLPGSGWVFEETGLVDLGFSNSSFKIKRAVMRSGGDKMLIYYWFPQRGRILTSLTELKIFAFWDTLISRRSDGALVRMVTPISGEETQAIADARLRRFAASAVPVLNTFLPGP